MKFWEAVNQITKKLTGISLVQWMELVVALFILRAIGLKMKGEQNEN